MTLEDSPGPSDAPEKMESPSKPAAADAALSSQRVFKKSSPNNKLTMYLSSRDLVVSAGRIDRITGVLLVDPEFIENRKVYGQVTLTFRYGREDEEVMGLKFCNEAIMCLAQLYPPPHQPDSPSSNTALQDALLKRLGPNAYPFSLEITPLAPPSVQLVPAKEYSGAPIGTSYDIRAYVADRADEKLHRRTTVRMGIRVVQRAFAPPSPYRYVPGAGRTSKERAKQNKKALLYGCQSAPPPSTTRVTSAAEGQDLSKSVETVGTIHHHETGRCVKIETTLKKSDEEPRAAPMATSEPMEYDGASRRASDVDQDAGRRDEGPRGRASLNEEHFRSLCGGKRPSLAAYLAELPAPRATIEKPFLLSDGRIRLTATLDKAIYSHGEEVKVSIQVRNDSNKTVRRLKVFIVQHVDVCMFSNGKFKNVVALLNGKEDCPVLPGGVLDRTYSLIPLKSSTKNWIALEDSYAKSGTSLASTVTSNCGNPDERNVFAIYVSYYVKVKLLLSVMGGEVSLKLPFTLMHTCSEFEHSETLTRVAPPPAADAAAAAAPRVEPEKDGM